MPEERGPQLIDPEPFGVLVSVAGIVGGVGSEGDSLLDHLAYDFVIAHYSCLPNTRFPSIQFIVDFLNCLGVLFGLKTLRSIHIDRS